MQVRAGSLGPALLLSGLGCQRFDNVRTPGGGGVSVPVRVIPQYRDVADWVLYGVALLAAVAAVVGFLGWISEQRKRPEFRFRWSQPNGEAWGPCDVPVFRVGTEYTLLVAIDNIGNGTAERAIINIVFPEFVELSFDMGRGEIVRGGRSADASVGLPPKHHVHFLVPPMFPSTPGLTSLFDFKLKVVRDPTSEWTPGPFHAAASLEDPRLNAKGRRRLGVLVVPLDGYPSVPDPWPGPPLRRVLSKAVADPELSVRVLPGRRVDRRKFRVEAPLSARLAARQRAKRR